MGFFGGFIDEMKKTAAPTDEVRSLFHHIHHEKGDAGVLNHEIHHCGGKHKDLPYTVEHCSCGKHRINRKKAVGHGTEEVQNRKGEETLDLLEVQMTFTERCPDGGWHLESGKVLKKKEEKKKTS